MCGVRYFGWIFDAHARQQAVARHREEDPRLPVLEDEQTAVSETTAPNATIQLAVGSPATSSACASGSAALELLVRHQARRDDARR